MNKKTVMVSLLILAVLYAGFVQKAQATWYIAGWIGEYVLIDHIAIDPWTLEFRVNETATFEIYLQNWQTVFVKTIDVTITVADAEYNETLEADYNWAKPPNSLAGSIYKLVKLTPQETGLVSLYIHVDYQYSEGNKTIEQEGTIQLTNVAEVLKNTYSDISSENYVLHNQIHDLDSRLQTLEASYSNLERWTYFLALTTCALIAATLLVAVYYRRKHTNRETRAPKLQAQANLE